MNTETIKFIAKNALFYYASYNYPYIAITYSILKKFVK